MGFCTKCGNQIAPNHAFCGECGTPVTQGTPAPASPKPQNDFLSKTKSSAVKSPFSSKKSEPARAASPPPSSSPKPSGGGWASGNSNSNSNSSGGAWASPPPSRPAPAQSQSSGQNWGSPPPDDEERKKKEEERKNKEREEAKRFKQEEQEYMNGKKNQIMESYINRKHQQSELAKTVDPAYCHCRFVVGNYEIKNKNNKPEYVVYRIDVEFDQTAWTIYRRYKQITQMDQVFRKEVKGYTPCLPSLKSKTKFDPIFLESRRQGLIEYMRIIENNRPSIFTSVNAGFAFLRTIAPSQIGDQKPPHFVLPFKII